MDEKKDYAASGSSPVEAPAYDHTDPRHLGESKELRMGEAADNYGDLATAEEYGYVSRGYADRLREPCRGS